ncbi:MAG: response regulator transcription factor [Oxalobacteraceae bacterium]|nr:MAG: response regulator transcription factor [Oxalobacteraceae bacterium]
MLVTLAKPDRRDDIVHCSKCFALAAGRFFPKLGGASASPLFAAGRKQTETELPAAVESVMQDTTWLSQRIVERLATVKWDNKEGAHTPEVSSLPERLRLVLTLVAQGLSDDDITAKLSIVRNTVRNHVSAIYKRLGMGKRSTVIVWARERGLGASPKPRTLPDKVKIPKRK